ncbi:hypothetical protein BGZ70_001124 [Mortierella alpina]|uniref:Rab-GAP TBC domain-containing protein n=1 Tax=Mortierella alpina TaxID=64518 RepID=A0A9P6IWF6_MORAP|nr:hypothetical protein BGZ70_001124 [Mortierella alpina]
MARSCAGKSSTSSALEILLGYLPLDKSKWESRRMEQRRLYYSFVKDLIVEPQLEGPDLSMEEVESFRDMDDPERSLFLQDNKTLEQIDKDVRRTLPDFAFFQLPIPYSPLCPLSIDPETRKHKKRTPSNTGAITGAEFGTTNGSKAAGSLSASGPPQRRGTVQGTSVEMKRVSITRAMTPNLKRRQTVTLMSPRAEAKLEKAGEVAAGQTTAACSQQAENGHETPPSSQSNGFKTPSNHCSPAPTELGGMVASAPGCHNEDAISLPDYLFSPIPTRRSLFKRVAHLNQDFGSREHQPHSFQKSRSKDKISKGQPLTSEQKQINFPLSSSPVALDGTDDSSEDELPQDLHWEAIERILFIFAKLNPGVGYVQGMNEILGPLYYLLANDPDEVSKAHAEAESFWLFHLLMAHFRDHFMRSLDRDRASGIGSSIARMNQRLRLFDEPLWQNLEEKGIAPEYYSFRWLTVLCTQEFEVPDVWRIWDSILADTGGTEKDYDFLLDFGCAMVCHLRDQLLDGDFADNVKLLQNYPPVDIQPILQLATVVRDRRIHPTTLHIALRPEAHEPPSRPSMDIRIWSSRSSISEQYTVVSTPDHWYPADMKALTIDGVQNSDRLDHSLEGSYHGSPLHTPKSATINKDTHQSNVEPSQPTDIFASISLFR